MAEQPNLAVRTAAVKRSRKRYPERVNARCKVYNAIRAGKLIRPARCQRCGVECKPEASHDDYSKPLEVEWLCRPCHTEKDLPTHCSQGHEWTETNTRRARKSHGRVVRVCRECARIACRRSYRKRGRA